MLQMKSVSIQEEGKAGGSDAAAKKYSPSWPTRDVEEGGGGKYTSTCPPVEEEDHNCAAHGKNVTEKSATNGEVGDVERNIGDTTPCDDCSCKIYCAKSESVMPSSQPTVPAGSDPGSNKNGDIVPQIMSRRPSRKGRKSLWSRSQSSRRLKMVVPNATGGEHSYCWKKERGELVGKIPFNSP